MGHTWPGSAGCRLIPFRTSPGAICLGARSDSTDLNLHLCVCISDVPTDRPRGGLCMQTRGDTFGHKDKAHSYSYGGPYRTFEGARKYPRKLRSSRKVESVAGPWHVRGDRTRFDIWLQVLLGEEVWTQSRRNSLSSPAGVLLRALFLIRTLVTSANHKENVEPAVDPLRSVSFSVSQAESV